MIENKIMTWKQGDIIYNINDEPKYAYLLEKGEVELISKNNVKVGYINSGEIFGEQACLLRTKRTLKTIATKNSRAVLISKKKIIVRI
jgi:CRP-like cAMP-binding protein